MLSRLIAVGLTGIVLMGYAPRWLTTSHQSWIIWVMAAGLVVGGPMLLRKALSNVRSRVRAVQWPRLGSRHLHLGGARQSSRGS